MRSLQSTARHEEVIRKSRFVARASRADSPEAALGFLDQVRDADATHNCWAYKIDAAYRFSDDGEPGGTAGRPILGAIESLDVDHVIVVVTRFFGGIKLGAGGLARAYGGVAAECLRRAHLAVVKRRVHARLQCPFDGVGPVYAMIERYGVSKRNEEFDDLGLHLAIALDEDDFAAFSESVRDATRGVVIVYRSEDDG